MMLLYRGWIETRVRFLFALPALLLVCGICQSRYAAYLANPAAARTSQATLLASRTVDFLKPGYESYVWLNWQAGFAIMLLPIIANAIASTGIVPHGGCLRGRGKIEPSATAFALTLPVRRRELLLWTAGAGMLQIVAIALITQLFSVLAALWQSGSYSVADAIVFALIEAAACAPAYGAGLILTALIDDDMNSRLAGMIPIVALFVLSERYHLGITVAYFRVLSGVSYITSGEIPWLGLSICVVVAAFLAWIAMEVVERRDY
jgi:hypothetical protein